METLTIKNLSFSYTDMEVLNEVDLSLKQGDYAVLTGENGSGKSTLLKLVLGELSPSQGFIKVFGKDISGDFPLFRIGYVPQNSISRNQSFPATVEEIMMTGMYRPVWEKRLSKRECSKQIRRTLEELHMEAFCRKRIGELSGGQQQRVMLARALTGNPQFLILDEPVAGMDLDSAGAFCSVLEQKHQQGVTILMVTHGNVKEYPGVGRFLKAEEGRILEI